jgi:hypothetical protein
MDRDTFTHIVDRTSVSEVPRKVGVTDVKRFGVLMLLKKVIYGSCIRMMSQCAASESFMSSRCAVSDLFRFILSTLNFVISLSSLFIDHIRFLPVPGLALEIMSVWG